MKLLQSLTGPSETHKGRSVSRPGGRFNPSQVRLKLDRRRVVGDRRCFNPSQVRLKPPIVALAVSWVLLQSLTGPSETPRVLPVLLDHPSFNPSQVRLKRDAAGAR